MPSLKAPIRQLLTRLKRRGRSREDAEDLIQEACLRLHEYCGKGHVVVNEEAFLTQTVKRLSIDEFRKAKHHPYAHEVVEELEQNLQIRDSGPTPDEVLDAEQRLENIRTALDAHSVRMREIYFAFRAGYSYKEIAANFGVSESTVEKSIARAVLIAMEHRDKV